MSTQIYLPASCIKHDPRPGHPECPARIVAITDAIKHNPIVGTAIVSQEYRLAPEQAVRAHDARYVEHLFEINPTSGSYQLDADTHMDQYSLEAALVAAGTVEQATKTVCDGNSTNAFCVVRPPGHHAEYKLGMGFCLFNSIALSALIALEQLGLERVAILDFDVHHGNGTEDIFRDDPRVLFCSSYQHPLYPHRNNQSITGQLVNVPLPAGTGSAGFRQSINERWWPELLSFKPQLILISAGFDAHKNDPLGGLELETDDFFWIGQRIAEYADQLCDGRLVAALEGGYDLDALAASTTTFLRAIAS